MECKDCIHYQVCQYHITEETKMTVAECSTGFKDKAKFIELPCKVGDTIYRICDNDYEDFVVTEIRQVLSGEFKIVGECNIHGYGFYNYKKCTEDFCGRNFCSTIFPSYEIGKTVFLTREEAEKALKERENIVT